TESIRPTTVLIRIDGVGRTLASLPTEGLTRKDLKKGGEENRLLARSTLSGAKIRVNQNGLPTSLAASGKKNQPQPEMTAVFLLLREKKKNRLQTRTKIVLIQKDLTREAVRTSKPCTKEGEGTKSRVMKR